MTIKDYHNVTQYIPDRYGRMRVGTCLRTDYGHQGCFKDILPVFDGRCSGRQTCRVDVRDLLLEGQKPCPEDLRAYLEARYTCIQGTTHPSQGYLGIS